MDLINLGILSSVEQSAKLPKVLQGERGASLSLYSPVSRHGSL